MIAKGCWVRHIAGTVNFGLPMQVLDVSHQMVYCKHNIYKSKEIYVADWFYMKDVIAIVLNDEVVTDIQL